MLWAATKYGMIGAGGAALVAAALAWHPMGARSTDPASITVTGYAVINVPAPSTTSYDINLGYQVGAASPSLALSELRTDLAAAQRELEAHGVSAAAISPSGINLNYVNQALVAKCQYVNQIKRANVACPTSGFQANGTVQVTLSTPQLVTVLKDLSLANLPGKPQVWVNSATSTGAKPAESVLEAGYRSALMQAHRTAEVMAAAAGSRLGSLVALRQGVDLAKNGELGGVAPPTEGPNQQTLDVTVTYRLSP